MDHLDFLAHEGTSVQMAILVHRVLREYLEGEVHPGPQGLLDLAESLESREFVVIQEKKVNQAKMVAGVNPDQLVLKENKVTRAKRGIRDSQAQRDFPEMMDQKEKTESLVTEDQRDRKVTPVHQGQ